MGVISSRLSTYIEISWNLLLLDLDDLSRIKHSLVKIVDVRRSDEGLLPPH